MQKNNNLVFIDIYEESIRNCEEFRAFKDFYNIFPYSIETSTKELLRSKKRILFLEIKNIFKMFLHQNIFKNKIIYLNGLHLSSLLYFKFRGRNHGLGRVVISNLYFHKIILNKYFNLLLKFLFYKKDYFIVVQSPSEVNFFRLVGPSLEISLIPYAMPEIKIHPLKKLEGNYFFSGGYTNRDYPLLFDVAKLFPRETFIVAASKLNSINFGNLPSNVRLYIDILPDDFNSLILNSKCVIIPLMDDVGSSGQMLCQAAMQMSKPIIYADFNVVSQYFISNNSGIPYNPGDINSLSNALGHFINLDSILRQDMGNKAYSNYRDFFTNTSRIKSIINYLNSIG